MGSMRSVDDQVVGQLVSAFYDDTVEAGGMDYRRPAAVLHEAVKKLRKKIPLEQLYLFT
jgi:hypothetical protein